MNADQLRDLARRFENSTPLPDPSQTPGDYVVNRTAHAMARFLRDMAVDISPTDPLCRKHNPHGPENCWFQANHAGTHSWQRDPRDDADWTPHSKGRAVDPHDGGDSADEGGEDVATPAMIREALDKLENLIVFFGDVPLTEKLSDIRDDLNGALSLEARPGEPATGPDLNPTEREADRNAVPLMTDTVRLALAKVWDAGYRAYPRDGDDIPANPYR
jgi:hypothetical protein